MRSVSGLLGWMSAVLDLALTVVTLTPWRTSEPMDTRSAKCQKQWSVVLRRPPKCLFMQQGSMWSAAQQ